MAFSQELADRICTELAEGKSLRAVCAQPGMPVPATVLNWTEAHPAFGEQYTRARERGYRLMADEIVDIADTPVLGVETKIKPDGTRETTEGDMIAHRRLQVDTRKWMLSKMLPKIYGDRLTNEHTGANGGPIETKSTLVLTPDEAYKRMLG
ncbi:MAG: terminase small subunit protein [Xanthomonadales bacterium]|nr:terminase small subunit protein [Xanthomonadales bacterium]